jgi:hypothetical protein
MIESAQQKLIVAAEDQLEQGVVRDQLFVGNQRGFDWAEKALERQEWENKFADLRKDVNNLKAR